MGYMKQQGAVIRRYLAIKVMVTKIIVVVTGKSSSVLSQAEINTIPDVLRCSLSLVEQG